MKIVLATANKGKIEEFKKLLESDVKTYSEILGDFDIPETGNSFKENAIIKAKAVYDKLEDKDVVVISDDSGITVPAINNEPGIYSARYSGEGATDKSNNKKLISKLQEINLKTTPAFYTACIALIYKDNIYTVHGFMHGRIIDEEKGEGGFGYDPMFIPNNYDKTLGELDFSVKKEISHRTKALDLAKKVFKVIS